MLLEIGIVLLLIVVGLILFVLTRGKLPQIENLVIENLVKEK